jgi:ceramide glucosyltransferase
MVELVIASVTSLVIAAGLIGSTIYCLVMLYSARRFFRPSARPRDSRLPGVTVLKPLKGLDHELYENLASLCRQDYGTFQIVCGVAAPNDPAVPVVRRLQAEFPAVDIELVIDARLYGTNHKVSNLHNMYPRAKHEVIVIADSDIRVRRDYLRRLVERLDGPRVGLVTCLYRAVGNPGLPTLLELLSINTDWCHMVLVARVVEPPTYAFGATIAMRRTVLEEIGGFLPIADHLADDYQLGQRVVARGYECVLAEQVVDTVIAVGSWRRLFQHQLRWARTYRICRPGGYFASIMTHATLWAVLSLISHGVTGSPLPSWRRAARSWRCATLVPRC